MTAPLRRRPRTWPVLAVNLNDQVDIFLRAGVTQFEVEPVELHRDVGQVVDPDDLVAHRAGKPAEALAFGEDAPRDVQRFDLFCISTMSMAIVYCSLVSASSAALSSSFELCRYSPLSKRIRAKSICSRNCIGTVRCTSATGCSPVSVCKDAPSCWAAAPF